jgi:hypothetical protein
VQSLRQSASHSRPYRDLPARPPRSIRRSHIEISHSADRAIRHAGEEFHQETLQWFPGGAVRPKFQPPHTLAKRLGHNHTRPLIPPQHLRYP